MEAFTKTLDRVISILTLVLFLGAGVVSGYYVGEASAYKQFLKIQNESVDALAMALPPLPALDKQTGGHHAAH